MIYVVIYFSINFGIIIGDLVVHKHFQTKVDYTDMLLGIFFAFPTAALFLLPIFDNE